MIFALLLAAVSLSTPSVAGSTTPFVPSEVEGPGPGAGVSTSLDTNGKVGEQVQTALAAERAFAADARTLGQWTAWRKWAAPDATMFVPQPVNAQAWLKDRTDPPAATERWPTASYVSCDGSLAVNTGGWRAKDGRVGYFSTVWQRQQDGSWKWVVDSGNDLKVARDRPARPEIERASCDRVQSFVPSHTHVGPDGTVPLPEGRGYANDMSLTWYWLVEADGTRSLTVHLAGRDAPVIDDRIVVK